jgi:DNA-binding winged helix-turn-helix (wHTH) protein/tetratricopeptide (TPR) repeat protein
VIYAFEGFELDVDAYALRRGGEVVSLEPQVFDVLRHLVEHRDRVVPKMELLDQVWGTRYVSESALTTRIKEVRRALDDDGRSQRLIRTATGRGYQFTGDVSVSGRGPARGPGADGTTEARPSLIGRGAELAVLHRAAEEASEGQRRVVLVEGEPGAGKTTLLEAWAAGVGSRGSCWVLVGQSVEHTGHGEPYLPLHDALSGLCRNAASSEVVGVLRRHAPSWLLQLPGLVDDDEAELLRALTRGGTRERMLREVIEAIEELSHRRTVFLLLEDLHWSDQATIEVVTALARRRSPAALMIVATYRCGGRPVDGLAAMIAELSPRRPACRRLVVGNLDRAATTELLCDRLGTTTVPEELVAAVAEAGGTNPLFLTTMVDHWVSSALVAVDDGGVVLSKGMEALVGAVPADLRGLVDHQLSQLPAPEREVLDVASVVGARVPTSAVAAAVGVDSEVVEASLTDAARLTRFLDAGEPVEWPVGTTTSSFDFRHSLYRQVVYERLPALRRARLHGVVGEHLATVWSGDPAGAGELAHHFVRSGDATRAVPALVRAATLALRRSGHVEAAATLHQARALAGRLPAGLERIRWEATIHAMLGSALLPSLGWAAPEVRDAYERALVLCQQAPEDTPLDSVLLGLAILHEYRAEYDRAAELMEQRLHLHGIESAPALRLESHELLACSNFHQGGFREAIDHAHEVLAAYDAAEHLDLMALFGENPAVSSRHWAAHSLWFLGHPDRALRMMAQALDTAGELAYSFSLSHAHEHAAYLHQYRLEPDQVREHAEVTIRLARAGGYRYREATGTMLHGWATAGDDLGGGLDELRRGLEAYRATGAAMDLPYFLALLADVLLRVGGLDEASAALDEARTLPRGRAYYYEPELLRLRAAVLHRKGHTELAAEAGRRALEVARALGARSLELRAALAGLDHAADEADRDAWCSVVASILDSFTEGFDTPDLRRAAVVLGRDEVEPLDAPSWSR